MSFLAFALLTCVSGATEARPSDGTCAVGDLRCHSNLDSEDPVKMLQVKWQVVEERCPEGTELAYGDDCPNDPFDITDITTTPAPCVNGMTPSGKQCEGKIKIKTRTIRVSRPCKTASGDECEGEFQKKIREIYEDKDGTWVMIRREQSQDGGETWKALPMSLTELAKFILSADEAEALPDARKCCKEISTTTASPSPKDCKLSEWSDWTTCSASCGSGTRSRSRTVVSPGEPEGECGCTEEAEGCQNKECPVPTTSTTTTTEQNKIQTLVAGTVKDGKTNDPIVGAKVRIPSQDLEAKTDSSGGFHFGKLEVGQVVLTTQAEGYTDETEELTIENGMSEINIKMIKPVKPGEWTIVMTWEKQPIDLEAVTTFGKCETKPYPTDDQSCDDDSGMSGKLDIDNNNIHSEKMADKPETTTLTKVNAFDGTIFFRVDNWWRINNPGTYYCDEDDDRYDKPKCGRISDSKARVKVQGPNTQKIFTVGKKDGDLSDDGKHWYVFSIDVKNGKEGIVSPCKRGGGCK